MSDQTDVVPEIEVDDPALGLELARELWSEGDYQNAAAMGRAALDRLGESEDNQRLRARLLGLVASALQCLGKLDEGAAAADRAIAVWKLEDEADPVELGAVLHTRAVVHLQRSQVQRAVKLLDRAAHYLESAGPGAAADFCTVLLTLAEVGAATGDSDAALGLCKRALDAIAGVEPTSDGHADELNRLTARAFLGLGGAYAQRGEAHDAKDYLARAVEFFDAGYGHGHPEMRAALEEVAAIYRLLGDDEAALAIEEELAIAADAERAADEEEL